MGSSADVYITRSLPKPYILQFDTLWERESVFGVKLPFETLKVPIMVTKIELLPILESTVYIIGVCTAVDQRIKFQAEHCGKYIPDIPISWTTVRDSVYHV
jgi:hypothetical protein